MLIVVIQMLLDLSNTAAVIHQLLEHTGVISVYFKELFSIVESYIMAYPFAVRFRDRSESVASYIHHRELLAS